MSNVRTSERSQDKPVRTPMGGLRYKLQLSEDDMKEFKRRKKVTHWFNDDPGRLDRAKAGGYSFVDPKYAQSLGQGVLHGDGKDAESNARVSVVVSRSDPIQRAYLMEISEKFYKEDQAAKEAELVKIDDAVALGGKRASDLEEAYRPK